MKSKHCLFLLCFSVILCSLGHAPESFAATDPVRGRVTTGINLRAAPGLSGKVITSLEAGTVVTITGGQSGWYQIAYEDEAYGYRGWVYAKYIKTLSSEPAPPVPPAFVAKPRPVQAVEAVPEPAAFPERKITGGDSSPLPAEMPTNTIELIQAAAVPKSAGGPDPATPVSSGAEKTDPPQITQSTTPAETAPPAPKGSGPETVASTGKTSAGGPGPGDLLSVVLKISSVFLSCLALLISYRTFHLVTAASKTS